MTAPKFTFELGTASIPLTASLDPTTGKRRIEGVSSSTLRDGHGDEITLKALQKMAKQAIGMNVWLNHEYKVPDDVFGTITRAMVRDSGERDQKTGLPIFDLHCGMDVEEENDAAVRTHKMIEKGKKLGISVGAMLPQDGNGISKSQDGGRYVLDDLDLVEMSIVGVPANSRCWATVATKSIKDDTDYASLIKELDSEDLDADEREGRQTSKIDVEEGTDPDGKGDGIVTGGDIMDPGPGPDPDAKPAEVEDGAGDGEMKTREDVEEGGHNDGIVTGDDVPGLGSDTAGETKKTRVTVWDGDKTVQIDTGRSRSKGGDDQSAQDDPESAGGLPSTETKALTPAGASNDELLIRSLRSSLTRATERADAAEADRDRALEHAADVVSKAADFIDKIGQLPMGRRATFDEVRTEFKDEFATDLDRLTFLDPSVKRLLIRAQRDAEIQKSGSPT